MLNLVCEFDRAIDSTSCWVWFEDISVGMHTGVSRMRTRRFFLTGASPKSPEAGAGAVFESGHLASLTAALELWSLYQQLSWFSSCEPWGPGSISVDRSTFKLLFLCESILYYIYYVLCVCLSITPHPPPLIYLLSR